MVGLLAASAGTTCAGTKRPGLLPGSPTGHHDARMGSLGWGAGAAARAASTAVRGRVEPPAEQARPLGVIQIDDRRRVVKINDWWATNLGCSTGTAVMRECLASLGTLDTTRVDDLVAAVLTGAHDARLEIAFTRADGSPARGLVTIAAVQDADGARGVSLTLADVTEEVHTRAVLHDLAIRDGLTGCLNRGAFVTTLSERLDRAGPGGIAVIFADLDDFKAVNDSHGHLIGDDVLRLVARRFTAALRQTDVVSRWGGDEFVVLLRGVTDATTAGLVVHRLRDRVSRPARVGAVQLRLQASLGVAMAERRDSALRLIARADRAMYRVKRAVHDEPVQSSRPPPAN